MFHALKTTFERDPAARWTDLPFYPHLYALGLHRLAHGLYRLGLPFLPRFLSALSRLLTGIEIHPGARIGKGFFVDHGAGVVIGETAVVGDYCTLFQGVTLGGTGKEKGKRHPTLDHHVTVAAGAKILGNIRVGHHAKVGANAVVLKAVPPNATVVGVPGRVVRVRGRRVSSPLDHGNLPDPLKPLLDRIQSLEKRLGGSRARRPRKKQR